jgi:poly(A) polymerase
MFWIFKKNSQNLDSKVLSLVDPDAKAIVERLKAEGFESYLVGGCVRDLLLGQTPKDFDIATSASPQKVRNIIPRSFIIGRRFRIVVAKRNARHPFEMKMLFPTPVPRLRVESEFQITTFRREPETSGENRNENVFGNAKEDAFRRDFTINGLFLDPSSGRVVDFVQGLKDIEKRLIRMIGNPLDRFKEDSIRILRAIRFSARTGFKLEPACERALALSVSQLQTAKGERVREEIIKVIKEGMAESVFGDFDRHNIWPTINPGMERFRLKEDPLYQQLIKICHCASEFWHSGLGTGPLLFLFFYSLLESKSADRNQTVNSVAENLKVSKAERDELSRISVSLKRLARTNDLAELLHANPKHIQNLSQTFYCLEVLARAQIAPWAELWARVEQPWRDFASSPALQPAAGGPDRQQQHRRRRGRGRRRPRTGHRGAPHSHTPHRES